MNIMALVIIISITTSTMIFSALTDLQSVLTSEQSPLRPSQEATIRFIYQDEPLVNIIYQIAALKGINIIVPSGASTITAKITMHNDEPMDVQAAWNMFLTILDVAGYNIIDKGNNLHTIAPINKNINREPLPLYIGINPSMLPTSDERIRVLYFFTNFKASGATDSEVPVILKEMLPDTSSYQVDERTNSVLISGKAREIQEILTIIQALDQTTFREKLEVVKLANTSAEIVATLFNTIFQEDRAGRYKIDTKKDSEGSFFSKNVKIIPDKRLNKLFLIGKEQAVTRIKEFIIKHIDLEMDSGKSILHVHQLQYLDAAAFAKVLEAIVESRRTGGTGQSTGAQAGSVERFFEGVIVKADKPESKSAGYFGGNKLIIAAKNDDWLVIKSLIEELDQPQPQVIIEVLIADLTVDQTRALANVTRNPKLLPLPGTSAVQSANINTSGVILDSPLNAGSNVASDLLGSTSAASNPASTTRPGSMVISISDQDGRTWSITQLLQTFDYRKIISHPHVVATNNTQAKISVGETRLLPDEAVTSSASTTVPFREQQANLTITITPRISSANQVNLEIFVDITQFLPSPQFPDAPPRATRQLNTSANVKSGDILALGGLLRTDISDSGRKSPIFGDVPILGWLTKGRDREDIEANLTIFISPIIVPARLRGGVGEYTKDHITIAEKYLVEGELFDSLRDPISRFFFRNDKLDGHDPLVEFMGVGAQPKGNIPGIDIDQIQKIDDAPVTNPLDNRPPEVETKNELANKTERKHGLTTLLQNDTSATKNS